MEVVGAVSSVLSLIDVAIRSSDVIRSLVSTWRDAPIGILALGNEIEDSKSVLAHAYPLIYQLERAPSEPTNDADRHALAVAIHRQLGLAVPVWNELQAMLELLRDGGGGDGGGRVTCSKGVRFRWLKFQRKIGRLRETLRDRRFVLLELVVSSST